MVKKLIKFYSQTCPPCKMLGTHMSNLGVSADEEYDIGVHTEKVDEFGISGVPTLILVDVESGSEIERVDGMGAHAISFLKSLAI